MPALFLELKGVRIGLAVVGLLREVRAQQQLPLLPCVRAGQRLRRNCLLGQVAVYCFLLGQSRVLEVVRLESYLFLGALFVPKGRIFAAVNELLERIYKRERIQQWGFLLFRLGVLLC